MGLLVDGVWRDDSFDKARMEGGRFNRPTTKFRNWITPDGSPGPSGEGGFAGRDRPLSPLRVAGLPVGAPHHHLPPSEAAGERHLDVGDLLAHGRERLDLRPAGRLERRLREPDAEAFGNLSAGRCQIHRPRHRAGAVGQEAQDHRQQRVVRDHPDAELGVRRPDQREHRLLSAGAAERDRRRQRPRLSERQQRRLSRGLRHRAGRLRGGVPQRVRGARRHRAAAGAAALRRRPAHDRGRLAAVRDADPLRRGLLQPLQVQPAPHRATTRTCRIISATSIRCRASTRP